MTNLPPAAVIRASPGREWLERIRPLPSGASLVQFAAIAVQLALLMILMRRFEIEPGSGLLQVLPVVFAGFLVHAALPMNWRLPFFLMLSIAVIGIVLGPIPGAVVVLVGLTLIGVCHLPVAFSTRVLLLLILAGVLAALRTGALEVPAGLTAALAVPALPRLVLPVLGSMFMFRLMIYLYDLRHEEKLVAKGGAATARPAVQPASVWARLSYFFLLPNVLFLLFPIVDYRTYRRTYYDRKPQEIYQQGIWWIALGLVHLLVYRLVYHYLVPMPEEVQGLGGVVRFLLSAYLIYLRVSGQFHLIIGLLCLFGFNLPPAHKFFLLASSFTDFWRRARIEWKDFMVKVFYYPALVPLQRKLGALPALVVTTVWVFIATWLLHSVQWFWLRGDFRLSATDGVFWTAIGGCVLVNSVLETVRGRARSKAASEWTVGPAIVHALKVMGMITFLCFLWSYWSSPSVAFWLSFLSAAKESGPGAYALLAAALLAVLAAGVLAQYIAARISVMSAARGRQQSPRTLMWRPALVVTAAVLLLAVRMPASQSALGSPIAGVVTSISTNRLNEVDQEREDRGYYEELLDEPRSTAAWLAATGSPPAEEPVEDADDPMAAEPIDAAGTTPIGSADSVAALPAATAPAPAGVDAGAADAPPSVKASQPREPVPSSETSMSAAAPKTAPVTAPAVTPNVQRVPVAAPSAASAAAEAPNRTMGRRLRIYERDTKDLLLWENAPNFTGSFKWAPLRTNEWGMRDKSYSLERPSGTYRIALLGSSMTVGAGVPVEETMEWLLEERLNREGPGAPQRRYEILNFSVGAYGIMQNAVAADQKAMRFSPNAILVGVFSIEQSRMAQYLVRVTKLQLPVPYPYVQQKLREAGVTAGMEDPELRRRLGPIAEDLVRWSYQHIVEIGKQRGVAVVGIVLPEPRPPRGGEPDIDKMVRLATSVGMPLLDLRGIYDGHAKGSFALGEMDGATDPHWNVAGHKLISDRVYELLREQDARALNLGFSSSTTPRLPSFPEYSTMEGGTEDDAPAAETSGGVMELGFEPPSVPGFASQAPQQGGKARYWPHERVTKDMLLWENIPNYTGEYKGAPIKINQWGMRDLEYTLAPPRGTYRIALLGSSMTMGPGVLANLTVEGLLEDRLNREGPGAPQRDYEILNFSTVAYGLMQNVAVLDRKVFPFAPNAVVVGIFSLDAGRMRQYLMMALKAKVPITYPYVQQKLKEAGVTADMEEPELRRRLATISDDLIRWSYQHIVEVCKQRGVPVVGVVLPEPRPSNPAREAPLDTAARLAAAAGLPLLDLRGVYNGQNIAPLRLNHEQGDAHWSVVGHKLIADRIYDLLRANDANALKLGFTK